MLNFYGMYYLESIAFHGTQEKMETTVLFRSNKHLTREGKSYRAFNISAASLRNRLRTAWATGLVDALGLKIKDLPALNFIVMFGGGKRLEKSDTVIYLDYIRELYRWLPGMGLFGGTTEFNMLNSVLVAHDVAVFSKEDAANFAIPKKIMQVFQLSAEGLPAASEVSEFQFNTKRDPRLLSDTIISKKLSDLSLAEQEDFIKYWDDQDTVYQTQENPGRQETVANMFNLEVLCTGVPLYNKLAIDDRMFDLGEDYNQRFEGCLGVILDDFKKVPYLGGKKSAGMGMVSFDYLPAPRFKAEYLQFIKENEERIRAMVLDPKLFADPKNILQYRKSAEV